MSKNSVSFSRLLRIFPLWDKNAFVIELEENNEKKLYLSYSENCCPRYFKSLDELEPRYKRELNPSNISEVCLMSVCTDASGMFVGSKITDFKADCSNLKKADFMFLGTNLSSFDADCPNLTSARGMFLDTNIKEKDVNLDFSKLTEKCCMFEDEHN